MKWRDNNWKKYKRVTVRSNMMASKRELERNLLLNLKNRNKKKVKLIGILNPKFQYKNKRQKKGKKEVLAQLKIKITGIVKIAIPQIRKIRNKAKEKKKRKGNKSMIQTVRLK